MTVKFRAGVREGTDYLELGRICEGEGIGFFWGIGVALLTGGFVILLLILIWVFSPLVVGMWVGRRFSPQPFGALLVGIAVIAVFSRLPLVGLGISGMTFLAALGALILGRPLQPLPPQV